MNFEIKEYKRVIISEIETSNDNGDPGKDWLKFCVIPQCRESIVFFFPNYSHKILFLAKRCIFYVQITAQNKDFLTIFPLIFFA